MTARELLERLELRERLAAIVDELVLLDADADVARTLAEGLLEELDESTCGLCLDVNAAMSGDLDPAWPGSAPEIPGDSRPELLIKLVLESCTLRVIWCAETLEDEQRLRTWLARSVALAQLGRYAADLQDHLRGEET